MAPTIDTTIRHTQLRVAHFDIQHTWSHDHVLKYGPLETVQQYKQTPTRSSYLDCIHEVGLKSTNKLVVAGSREKAKRITFVGRYLQQQSLGKH
jgi:hypothetical protein